MDNVFKTKIKELRKEKRLNQTDLAQLLNTTQDTVSLWECGKSYPDVETLIKISSIFDIQIDEILGRVDDFGNVNLSTKDVIGNNNTVNSHNIINSNNALAESLTKEEQELLSLWRKLSADKRKSIINLMK